MPATVVLNAVSVTRIYSQGSLGEVHDGAASYRVASDSINLLYTYKFVAARSISSAVMDGAAYLKRELDDLSLATQNIQTALSSP
jgi:hypothetical protein